MFSNNIFSTAMVNSLYILQLQLVYEGELKWPCNGHFSSPCPFICLPVCLFICLSRVFLWNRLQKFSVFLHKVRVSYNLKSDGAQVFEKKNKLLFWSFRVERAQNGPKARFFKFMKNQHMEFF